MVWIQGVVRWSEYKQVHAYSKLCPARQRGDQVPIETICYGSQVFCVACRTPQAYQGEREGPEYLTVLARGPCSCLR